MNTPTAEVQAAAKALVDKAQKLEAEALGYRMEAAKKLGMHDEARQYQKEMATLRALNSGLPPAGYDGSEQQANDQAALDRCERMNECFFTVMGDIDGGRLAGA